jgi:transposase InsO family protein
MDFIIDLPPSSGYKAILVVVGRFTKMTHFLVCKKEFTSEDTAQLLLQKVFCPHGLPQQIVSDQGPQFIAIFWKRLFELLQVTCSLSSAHHPQMDGQSERTIQTLEQYLRCFINYQQDDWFTLLSRAEFAYKNSINTSTMLSPFYALIGYHPCWNFLAPSSLSKVPATDARIRQLQNIHFELLQHLGRAQQQQKVGVDRHHSVPPSFDVGDQVWLFQQHVRTSRPCEKL